MTEREAGGLFQGAWEITSSEVWDKEALDLVEQAQFRFLGRQGELGTASRKRWSLQETRAVHSKGPVGIPWQPCDQFVST